MIAKRFMTTQTAVGRFFLLTLLQQPAFSEIDVDGKIKESLRTGDAFTVTHLEPRELLHNVAMPMFEVMCEVGTDKTDEHMIVGEIIRLLTLESAMRG